MAGWLRLLCKIIKHLIKYTYHTNFIKLEIIVIYLEENEEDYLGDRVIDLISISLEIEMISQEDLVKSSILVKKKQKSDMRYHTRAVKRIYCNVD